MVLGSCNNRDYFFHDFILINHFALQYLLLGMEHKEIALVFDTICCAASLIRVLVVQKTIQGHRRDPSIIFSVSIAMALGTIFMTA